MSTTTPPITIERFTELAHRTASRYSHRSEPSKVAYTFLPHTLEHFHHLVCAAIGANAQPVDARVPTNQITEEMHVAAVKVLLRASGLDGLPQRMLDAMLSAAPQPPEQADHPEQDLGMVAQPEPAPPTPEQIDTHLDAILRAAGSSLRHYTLQKLLDGMRAAMRKAITGDPT